jgi:hypothetical protein
MLPTRHLLTDSGSAYLSAHPQASLSLFPLADFAVDHPLLTVAALPTTGSSPSLFFHGGHHSPPDHFLMIAILAAIAPSRSPLDRKIVCLPTTAFSQSRLSHAIPAFRRSKESSHAGENSECEETIAGRESI